MILVTGGAGFIGSVLVGKLLKDGKQVRVLDNLMYTGESLLPNINSIDFYYGDIRNAEDCIGALKGVEHVIHLAAIVGENACRAWPTLAQETNLYATRQLWEIARDNGVKSFIFSSTCSNYGKAELATEETELNPLGIYAKTKVDAERWLLEQDEEKMHTVILRFATAFGLSPRMRWDLLINNFILDAWLHKELRIYDPLYNRPYCHVKDISSMIVGTHWLVSTFNIFNREVFNVGGYNRTKMEIAKLVKDVLPSTTILTTETGKGRDYTVDFSKIHGYGLMPWPWRPPETEIRRMVNSLCLFDNLIASKWANA